MRRMPIPCRCLSFLPGGCPPGIYAGLASLSEGCPPAGGRLHTCYSPVRQSPAGSASTSPVALRLACVKPAASVHPEPGSNSPLFILFSFFSFKDDFRNLRSRRSDSNISNCCLWPSLSFCIVRSGIAGLYVPCTLTTFTLLVLWQNVIVLLRLIRCCPRNANAKLVQKRPRVNTLRKHFRIFLVPIRLSRCGSIKSINVKFCIILLIQSIQTTFPTLSASKFSKFFRTTLEFS